MIAHHLNLKPVPGSSNGPEAMVCDHFKTQGQAVALGEARPGGLTLRGGAQSSSKQKRVPMTVLVIDELDMANKTVLATLVRIATSNASSLILIGMGNLITLLDTTGSAVTRFVFKPYDVAALQGILKSIVGGLFQHEAVLLLACRVCKNNTSKTWRTIYNSIHTTYGNSRNINASYRVCVIFVLAR